MFPRRSLEPRAGPLWYPSPCFKACLRFPITRHLKKSIASTPLGTCSLPFNSPSLYLSLLSNLTVKSKENPRPCLEISAPQLASLVLHVTTGHGTLAFCSSQRRIYLPPHPLHTHQGCFLNSLLFGMISIPNRVMGAFPQCSMQLGSLSTPSPPRSL